MFPILRFAVMAVCLSVVAPFAFAQSDLFLTKTGPEEANADTDVTYEATLFNMGVDAATDTVVTDTVPVGMTIVSYQQTAGAVSFTCTQPVPAPGFPETIVCTADAPFPAGATATFEYVFHIDEETADGTVFTNVVSASASNDENEENNSAFTNTTVSPQPQADLAILKSGPSSAGEDTDVVYTIQLNNAGPDTGNVTLTDTIPGDLTFVSLSLSGQALSCTTPAVGAGGTITCTNAAYPAGATTTLTLTVHVPAGTPSATEYQNTATVASPNDLNEENNLATTTLVTSATDVRITKSGPANAVAGDEIAYTLLIENISTEFAEGVGFSDVLPAGTTFVSVTQNTGSLATCSTPDPGANGTVTCEFGQLGPGLSASFTLKIEATQSFTNTATVATSSFDTNDANDESSVATTVTPSADVSVTKTAPATVNAGENITWTILVQNAGPSPAADVTVTDTLPAGTTFVSASAGCSGTTTITCTAGTLAANTSATFTITAAVSPSATGTISNTANATSTTSDPDAASDRTSTANTTVTTSADLAVDKTPPANVSAGETAAYTIVVRNNGPSDAANVSLTDATPANTTFASIDQVSGPLFNCTTPAAGGTGNITCTIASLADGASATFTLTFNVSSSAASGSTIVNTASIDATTADPAASNDSDSTSSIVTTTADLRVTKSGAATATAGQTHTYAITLVNDGEADAQNVTLTDTIPANWTYSFFAQNTGPAFACTTPDPGTAGTITCTIATFANNDTATFMLIVNIPASAVGGTVVTNNATATSSSTPDPNVTNNTGSSPATVAVSADISVVKNGPATAVAGDTITYTIGVVNNGPSDAANVSVNDTIPANTTFVSLTQTTGPAFTCTNPTATTIDCDRATLASGALAAFTLVLNVASSVQNGTPIANTVTASATSPDPDAFNNSSTTPQTIINTIADVRVTKGAPGGASAGTSMTYTIAVENLGPSDARNVAMSDVLPPQTTFVSITQNTGPAFTCTNPGVGNTGTVTCTIASLADNAAATFTLVVNVSGTAETGSNLSNTATVSTTTEDPNPANNTATTNTSVAASADLRVAKTGPATTPAGANVSYTITAENLGSATASNVTLTDVLPVGTTFVSMTQTSGPAFTCAFNFNVTCTRASFVPNAPATFTLVVGVSPTATGSITNRVDIVSLTPDSSQLNNGAATTASITPGTTDLRITKTSNETRVAPGSTVSYTIVASNAGPAIAYDVVVTDPLPSGATFVSVSSTQGTCTGTSTVVCTIGELAPNGNATITLTVRLGPGVSVNTATISAANGESNPANNAASAAITAAGDGPVLSPVGMLLMAMSLAAAGWFAQRMRL
jgi:large repetitive protein